MRYIISYVSTVHPDVSSTDISQLMDYVRTYNNTIGLTGILMYSEGNFFQVLEGEEKLVKMMFERIKQDSKHYNIIKMLDSQMNTNSFSEYHSSFTVIADDYSKNELLEFLKKEKDNNPEHYKSISYLTQRFMKLL
ncbi:BLUF domain-containing protein [Aquimarina sp. U1-2]|uniref:BLUF domain-containing protein n=1 Tax=Aquimarina sp. U1-2 TaxID=2823141 RepID=UPI001AECBCCC|nr:BLUF domain-containing protein [Aquimarina sp. U1-2]MBP2833668.1 BLUF domain-containing protein [Aquimarina sp. U1-2]